MRDFVSGYSAPRLMSAFSETLFCSRSFYSVCSQNFTDPLLLRDSPAIEAGGLTSRGTSPTTNTMMPTPIMATQRLAANRKSKFPQRRQMIRKATRGPAWRRPH